MWGGGLGSAAEDGLWFYSVGRGFSGEDNGALVAREETKDVRRSYSTTLLGGVRSASGMVFVEYDNELWLFNGPRYLTQTRNELWIEGSFQHSVKSAIGIRHLPMRFQSSNGALYTLSRDYQTDNGQAVTWTYTTGILDGPRTRLRQVEMRGTGRPTLTVTTFDGLSLSESQSFQKADQDKNYVYPVRLRPGGRYRLSFSGVAGTDTVEYCALEFEQAGEGAGN